MNYPDEFILGNASWPITKRLDFGERGPRLVSASGAIVGFWIVGDIGLHS
jgi:hypothetical protein